MVFGLLDERVVFYKNYILNLLFKWSASWMGVADPIIAGIKYFWSY